MSRPPSLAPFVTQTRREHAATVVGAVVLFAIVYFGSALLLYGDLAVLEAGPDAFGPRLFAGSIASACCWAYFAIAFTRGYGGPVLNAFPYPVLVVTATPIAARWLLFGPAIEALRTRLLLPSLSVFGETLLYGVVTIGVGIGAFTVVLFVWSSLLASEDDRREWERTHLDPAFREAFVEGERDR